MAMLTTVFVGCKSKAEKAIEEMRGITQQFIVDMNNAQSKEEALQILKAYEERGKYEEMKLSEEDKKEYLQKSNWEDIQENQRLQKEAQQAIENAKKRFREK